MTGFTQQVSGSAGPEVSIVTPMHNEELCLPEFYRRVSETLQALGVTYEILAVSDGSTDGTNRILSALAKSDPAVRPVVLSRNIGQWAAVAAGLQESRGRYVVVMDADLQHAPEEIPLLLAEIQRGYDLVSGSRGRRTESFWLRRLPSLVANALLRVTTKCPIRDMGGFKCLRGDLARQLRLRAGQHRLLPALVYIMGGSVSEVIVSAPPRFAGESHYSIARATDVLFDILLLWFEGAHKARPLYLFGRITLITIALAAAMLVYVLFEKLAYGEPMSSRPPFYISLTLILTAIGTLFFGFVLEMISDVLQRVGGRSVYVVQSEPRLCEAAQPPGPAALGPEHAPALDSRG